MTRLVFIQLALIIIAALIFVAMLCLGVWQLDRGAEKQAIADMVSARSQTHLEFKSQVMTVEHRYANASVEGKYMGAETFFLDGQVHNGQVGYHVITPFKIDSNGVIVLINRGWVPVGLSREKKPKIMTPSHKLNLTGRLNLPPSRPVFWNEAIPVVQNGAWQFLDLVDYSHVMKIKIAPLIIELDKTLDQAGGYVRQWRSYDNHWISRHRAYALQWFSMAAVFLMLCVFVGFKSKNK